MPRPGHDEKFFIQTFARFRETLNESNPFIPRFHIVGFTLEVLEVVASVYVMVGQSQTHMFIQSIHTAQDPKHIDGTLDRR